MADYAIKGVLGTTKNPDSGVLASAATPVGPSSAANLATHLASLVTLLASVQGAHQTAVATDVATLVADGATPTQAHVTTLNTDWGVLNTAITALTLTSVNTDSALLTALMTTPDAYMGFNTTTIVRLSQLKEVLDKFLTAAASTGMKP